MGIRYIFFLNNSDYLNYDTVKKQCVLTFLEDTDPTSTFWLLGEPFLRVYYSIHDMSS